MLKPYFEELIKKLEIEKERETAPIKDRLMREKIAPYNADIDASRAKALAEVDNKYNLQVAELKKKCEEEKQALIKLGEDNKKANMETVFATDLVAFTSKYDKEIAKLRKQIEEIEE